MIRKIRGEMRMLIIGICLAGLLMPLVRPFTVQAAKKEEVYVLANSAYNPRGFKSTNTNTLYCNFLYSENGLLTEMDFDEVSPHKDVNPNHNYHYFFSYNDRNQIDSIEKFTSDNKVRINKYEAKFEEEGRTVGFFDYFTDALPPRWTGIKYDKNGNLKKITGSGTDDARVGDYECDEDGRLIKSGELPIGAGVIKIKKHGMYFMEMDKKGNFNFNIQPDGVGTVDKPNYKRMQYKTIYDKRGNLIRVRTINCRPNFDSRRYAYKKITVAKKLVERIKHQQYYLKYYRYYPGIGDLPMMLW